jgi:hypothetical protein
LRTNCGKAVSKLCLLAAIAPTSIFLGNRRSIAVSWQAAAGGSAVRRRGIGAVSEGNA